jgi:hypothetical protein
MNEIRSALASGKEVTTHTDPLTIPGYRGSGYIIADPVTGEGIYKISGGKNGGFIAGALLGAIVVISITVIFVPVVNLIEFGLLGIVVTGIAFVGAELVEMYGDDPNFWGCFWAGFAAVFFVAFAFEALTGGEAAKQLMMLLASALGVPFQDPLRCFR